MYRIKHVHMYRVGLGFVGIFSSCCQETENSIVTYKVYEIFFLSFFQVSSSNCPVKCSGEVALQTVVCSAPPWFFESIACSLSKPSTSVGRFDVLVRHTQRPGSLPHITPISLHISYPVRIYS